MVVNMAARIERRLAYFFLAGTYRLSKESIWPPEKRLPEKLHSIVPAGPWKSASTRFLDSSVRQLRSFADALPFTVDDTALPSLLTTVLTVAEMAPT